MVNPTQLHKRFPNIILASSSPQRADLLRQIGFEFQVCPSEIAEPDIASTSPATDVGELALAKAKVVASTRIAGLIIGADTIVVIDQQVIGKPAHEAHAMEILTRLSGNRHEVITGVALIDLNEEREVVWTERTAVYFRCLRPAEIREYVCSGEALDKAGAYGIQGRAAAFVERIEGCYFNVVGLPLAGLVERLWELANG